MRLEDFDFRLWSNEAECYVDISTEFKQGKVSVIPRETKGNIECIELWTGFTDKNGARIYEGDIVRYKGQNRVCVYECATYYLIDTSIEKEFQVDCGTRLQRLYETGSLSDTEVIGNIHEDKELLKKEEACK